MRTPSSVDVKTQVRDFDMRPWLERERLAVREIQIGRRIDHIVHLIRAGQLLKIEVLDHVILGRATAERAKDYSSLKELGYFYS